MIEYPSIINSSKAPRSSMIAFHKIDGSNIRVKWTPKKGFCLFGSRTQLLDETHPHLGGVIPIFNERFRDPLHEFFSKNFKNNKEVYVYGEYFGPDSFAGIHTNDPDDMMFSVFDVLIQMKSYVEFLLPQDFISCISPLVPTPIVYYEGNLTDKFISDVRNNSIEGYQGRLSEGVVCKGTTRNGAYRGKVWMCKIKTNEYLNKLKNRFGEDWKKYGE